MARKRKLWWLMAACLPPLGWVLLFKDIHGQRSRISFRISAQKDGTFVLTWRSHLFKQLLMDGSTLLFSSRLAQCTARVSIIRLLPLTYSWYRRPWFQNLASLNISGLEGNVILYTWFKTQFFNAMCVQCYSIFK